MSRIAVINSFVCTLFWGVAGALVAGLDMHPGTLIAISCIVQAPVQLLISRPGRNARAQTPWRLVAVGVMTALLTASYFISLRLAAPALAAALHLSAPLISCRSRFCAAAAR
jgi:hypothetical protein